MTKWDYYWIEIAHTEPREEPAPYFFSTTKVGGFKQGVLDLGPNGREVGLRLKMEELGQDGWELVSVDRGNWYFKRPVA